MKKLLIALLAVSGMNAQDMVKFSAEIANPNSDSLVIKGRGFKKVLKGKDGKFSDSFEAKPGFYSFFDGSEQSMLYFPPNTDIKLVMDAKMFDESIKYTGNRSKENNILAQFALDQEKLEPFMAAGDAAGFNKGFDQMKQSMTAKLADKDIDETFRNQMTMTLVQTKEQMDQMFAQKEKAAKMIGQLSPTFNYENHKGGKTKLEDLRGKYVYIDAWATWCGPCIREIPAMKEVEKKYHGKKIEFVSISIDEQKDHEKWKKFVTDREMGGVQLFADNAWGSEFAKAYAINSIPRFILIDPQGKVVDADAPRPSDPALAEKLDSLLN